MKINKRTLQTFAFLLIFKIQSLYPQVNHAENNHQSNLITNKNNKISDQSKKDQNNLQLLQEMFEKISNQTHGIEYSLQIIEHIINTENRISWDAKNISKAQLLLEIQDIKQLIRSLADIYTKELEINEAIIKGILFNTAFINYLLPIIQDDITTIRLENFYHSIKQKIEELTNNNLDATTLFFMFQKNDKNVTTLIDASSSIELTTFDKIYRYLESKPLLAPLIYASEKIMNTVNNYYGTYTIGRTKDYMFKISGFIEKVYFKDMINSEHLEKLAQELTHSLKNPTDYEHTGIIPSDCYVLVGPAQTGKTFFAQALNTLINEEFANNNETINFWNVTPDDLHHFSQYAEIFEIARQKSPIIVFIDDFDPKNIQELLTGINSIKTTDHSNKVIVIVATYWSENSDSYLTQKSGLEKIIRFEKPTYEYRKQYIEKQSAEKNINLSHDAIDTIAQKTQDKTYLEINEFLRSLEIRF